MSELTEENLTFRYFIASRKAQWLKGHLKPEFFEAKVLNFMTAYPLKFVYWAPEVSKTMEKCKKKLLLSNGSLLAAIDNIEKSFKYFSLADKNSYHPMLKNAFAGLIVPKIISQFFLEKDDFEINEDLNKICQLDGDFDFQTGELITFSMFPDLIPSGNYYVKDKITHFHELGIMRKYWLAPF